MFSDVVDGGLVFFCAEENVLKFSVVFHQTLNEKFVLTAHVGVVVDWLAPHAAVVVLVGSNAELIGRVGFQVVNDGVAGRTGLIDPLPVPLPVPDGVEPGRSEHNKGVTPKLIHLKKRLFLKNNYIFG